MKKFFLTYFLIVLIASKAQEAIQPLNGNINYVYKDLFKHAPPENVSSQKNAVGLQIPFIDDFYYAYKQSYPNQNLWSDSTTYINTGYGIAPLSIGVATFDGLNKYGYPYTPNLTNMAQSLPADTLRSKPINLFSAGSVTLQPTDSVALIFYYQARGRGDSPEQTDSLLVDFYKPNQKTWTSKVWFSRGNSNANTNDTVFKRGFVWISDTAFLKDNFQFRFRNKATTAGAFDHWHIDYIYLDKGRSMIADTSFDDIAFGYIPTPYLQNYSSMPWRQYKDAEKIQNNTVFIRNNSNNGSLVTNMTYENKLYDQAGVLTYSYTGGANPDLKPFKYNGWNNLPAHNYPAFGYTFAPFTDSMDYTIKHYIFRSGSSNDFIRENDTVVQHQLFSNYYALDDGSAEAGYYINGSGGKMGVKVKLNVLDTLRAVRIYFTPAGSMAIQQNTMGVATSSYKFRITIWSDAGTMPGNTILRDSLQAVKYYTKAFVNASPEYTLTTPLILGPGNYYVGIQQYVASGITVGFDRNIDHRENLYYDSGNGWNQSTIYGSLMMRPVFGQKIIPPVGISDHAMPSSEFGSIYPNPANDKLTIELNSNQTVSYRMVNVMGQTIQIGLLSGALHSIITSQLSNGIYFLILTSKEQSKTFKIIVEH